MTHQMPPVYSLHWDNISPAILQGQGAVFAKLGLELRQERHHHKAHGVWMNEVIARHQPDDVIVFCDIDAFPLTAQAYQEAVQSAERGAVFGLSQFSNHKKNTEVYAGPMFMAFTKATWQTLGSPSLKSSERFDAAEVMSARAREQKVALALKPPTSCIVSKWALGHERGRGTGRLQAGSQHDGRLCHQPPGGPKTVPVTPAVWPADRRRSALLVGKRSGGAGRVPS